MNSTNYSLNEIPKTGICFRFTSNILPCFVKIVLDENVTVEHWKQIVKDVSKIYPDKIDGWMYQ